jgi:hypothetical protein
MPLMMTTPPGQSTMKQLRFTEYMEYRARQRGFDLERVEEIVRFESERYADTKTGRRVVIAKHHGQLVLIPYEEDATSVTPVTVHATTRQQVRFRLDTGRFNPI